MSPAMRKEYLQAIRIRYKIRDKKGKGRILDEFCEVCGYQRKYAIRILNNPIRRPKRKPGPKPKYGSDVRKIIKCIWFETEQICSKRLKFALPLWLPYYEMEYGTISDELRAKVLSLSPATIDRLLAPIRAKQKPKGLCGTKPGTLIRNQIPIRTNNWDITRPGYLEADTVAHCGNSIVGDFIWSITFTDIYSGWTENRAIYNKGSAGVVDQVKDVESKLVFPILGFDCDNGSEFLNYHLLRYFSNREKPVGFTRSRPYRSNDNAHVEQKNWTHVRQLLGYERFSEPELVQYINSLYKEEWSLFQNFFCPSFKLLEKEKINSKYRRVYENPKTPYERILSSKEVSYESKEKLKETFRGLNPFHLKKSIEKKLKKIFNIHRRSKNESANFLTKSV